MPEKGESNLKTRFSTFFIQKVVDPPKKFNLLGDALEFDLYYSITHPHM